MPGEPGELTEPRLSVRARVPGAEGRAPRLDVERLEAGSGVTAVMGASGAGKSTLLAALAGLARPDRGRIALDGAVLFDHALGVHVPAHERRVALVFQSLALFPHMTVEQNVAFGVPGGSRASRRERARAWLSRARVEGLAARYPASLSGGEAQRVALARALASEPRALLLDEPFSALDGGLRRELGAELRALVEQLGLVAILVTHDAADAAAVASRVVRIEGGRLAG